VSLVYDGDWIVSALIEDRAERFPERRAVTAEDGTLGYGELRDRAARVGGALAELGVGPGDRVATMLESSLDYLAAWFGIAWSGAVDVPVNTEFKGAFLEHVVRESGASAMVIDSRWLERLADLDLPDLRHLLLVGPPPAAGVAGVAVHSFAEALEGPPAARTERGEADLLYVLYTSGTTGPSKGVMHSNRSALWNARAWIDILELTEEDVAYSMFPIFHVTARSAVITSTLWAGGRVVLRRGFSLRRFWDDVRSSRATFFAYMGAVIHLLHAQDPRADDADNSLRVAFGAAAPPEIVESFERRFGVELLEVYGSTELGPASAPRPGRRKPGTMGRPSPHLEVEVHDPSGSPCATGERGEITARAAQPGGMFLGYWRREEATREAFRHGWFHTGDGGFLDEDGYLVFTDRIKDSMRRRGENISSFEVERAVQRHPDVLECAAYAVPSELTEDEVMAAIVPRDGRALDLEQLLRFCAETMPRFAVPRYVRVVEQLPKTPSQRIQKYKLRQEGITADTLDRERA
jgi:carnitine-CoA ligase